MSLNSEDEIASKYWAIAALGGGGVGVSYNAFLLINRTTNREHQLHVTTIGPQFSLGGSGSSPSYTLFKTKKKVTFSSFSGEHARITTANIGIIWGYSIVYLTIWEGIPYLSDELAYIKIGGTGAMLPGGGFSQGMTKLSYGSGRPSGTVPRIFVEPPEVWDSSPRSAWVRSKPYLPPLITIPNDILFDFNKHDIMPKAQNSLLELAVMLNNRKKLPVKIIGHSDSKGTDLYNKTLSLKRAEAIKNWCIVNKVYRAFEFDTKGVGKLEPVKPNQKPDGSDNPEGRKENRRVEIKFSRHSL